jgi:uncharacterized lipoprotein YbaY
VTALILLLAVYNSQAVVILKGRVIPGNNTFAKDRLAGTTLVIKIEDVSVQDIGSVVLASRSIKLNHGKQFPLNFEIIYPEHIIDSMISNAAISISASILNSITNDLLYVTDKQYLLPRGSELHKPIILKVVKVQDNKRKIFCDLFD